MVAQYTTEDVSSVISDDDDEHNFFSEDDDADVIIRKDVRTGTGKRRGQRQAQAVPKSHVPKDSGYSDFAGNSPEERGGKTWIESGMSKDLLILKKISEHAGGHLWKHERERAKVIDTYVLEAQTSRTSRKQEKSFHR